MFYAPYVPRFPLCNIYCCSILKHVSLKGVVVTSTGGVGEYPKMNCISQHTRGKPHCAGLMISKHRDGPKGAHLRSREPCLLLRDLLRDANVDICQLTFGQIELRGKRKGTQTKTCGASCEKTGMRSLKHWSDCWLM